MKPSFRSAAIIILMSILLLQLFLPDTLQAQTKGRQMEFIYHEKKRYFLIDDVALYFNMTSRTTKYGIYMSSKQNRAEFIYNKRNGSVNGITVYFLEPPLVRGGRVYLWEKDFHYVLTPALNSRELQKSPARLVMLDPGHGGKDRGAMGPVQDEKTINLMLAKKLKVKLEASGFKVIMTRTSDTFPSLQDRAELCEKYKPDLFVSIHCNSTKTSSVSGIETFLMTPIGAASTSDSQPSWNKTPADVWAKNNFRLAYEVQRALVSATKDADRGVKHARFYVLRNAVCPAILIETGFLSNNREGRLLSMKSHQDNLVAAMALGIQRYQKLTVPLKPSK